MPQDHQGDQSMEQAIFADGRYPPPAYAFLHEGLAKAIKQAHQHESATEGKQHVTGQEICHALKDLAVERWGQLARTVLAKWSIRQTIDFGNMVYTLIDAGFMRRTDEDSIDDFRDVYQFDEAFGCQDDFDLKDE